MQANIAQSIEALADKAVSHPVWVLTFSGGKDSTAALSFVAWVLHHGHVKRPLKVVVVHSDTGQEYPWVEENAQGILVKVASLDGWEARTVRPEPAKRFYAQILGRGLPPVHPAFKGRWCTRSLKVDPMLTVMDLFARSYSHLGKLLVITGVRLGESDSRDAKLTESRTRTLATSCRNGGECGLGVWLDKDISAIYDPLPLIVNWKECEVFDWLKVFGFTREYSHPLAEEAAAVYRLYAPSSIDDDAVEGMRFGCIGCPAINRDKTLERYAEVWPQYAPLKRLYPLWQEMRSPWNRKMKPPVDGAKGRLGPLTMKARREFYERVRSIESEAGLVLIRPDEEKAIQSFWSSNAWPRGWTGLEVDAGPSHFPLFAELEDEWEVV